MDLLINAIESIQAGVEDYQVGTRPRLLSAARNVHAGVLLLYKEALLRRSPAESNEALIKAKTEPRQDGSGGITFVGVGSKTVDTSQIKAHFKSLGITTDWALFESIARVRNDIEHYYTKVNPDTLRGVIGSAFLLIKDFAETELEEKPYELLGKSTWEAMLAAANVQAAERKACDELLEQVDWGSEALEKGVREVRCSDCGSDLLRPTDPTAEPCDIELTCRACGGVKVADDFIAEAVDKALEAESYSAVQDGAEDPIADCPSCNQTTYVMSEGRCAYCGDTAVTECSACGTSIPASEMASSPLCGYCDYMRSKND